MEEESKPTQINTPDGTYDATEFPADQSPQQITVVTGSKLEQLTSLGSDCEVFLGTYLPKEGAVSLRNLDLAFRVWQTSGDQQHTDGQVIEILGGYLGNKLVADFNMKWVIVSDQYGTDYAVRSEKNATMSFPFSTVMKRIEDHEHDFLYPVYHLLKQTIEQN